MTIEFKENDHINEDKLNKIEAIEFIHRFLLPELYRHIKLKALAVIEAHTQCYEPNDNKPSNVAIAAWYSSADEHQKDIDYIQKTIDKLGMKFGWLITHD